MFEQFSWQSWIGLGFAVIIAIVVVLIIVGIVAMAVRAASRRYPGLHESLGGVRRRTRIMLAIVGIWIAVSLTLPAMDWRPLVDQG